MGNTANSIEDRVLICGEEFVPIRVASKMLGKSVRTIRDWIHKGKIPAVKGESGYKWYVCVDLYHKVMDAEV